jgi:MFS family permease
MAKKIQPRPASFLSSIPRTVVIVGLASLFTDMGSEGTLSILPLFLTQVLAASPAALGIIEGVAESTSSLLKIFSGVWTDRLQSRKPFILAGYAISGFCRPLIGLATTWPFVLLFRFIDRIGKGVRGAPRDALVADVTTPSNRGASFGFHSAMDDAGAILGPVIVSLLLLAGLGLRQIIFWSVVPGVLAVGSLLFVHEKKAAPKTGTKNLNWLKSWNDLDGNLKRLFLAVFVFTLGNSTDAFILIRLSQVGVKVAYIPLLWALNNGVRMVTSLYGGRLSDQAGRKPVIVLGWFYYAVIYAAFALVSSPAATICVFLAYGAFYGLCEPSEKAFVADMTPKDLKGTAFGYYNLIIGLSALPASLLFGWVASVWSYPWAFVVGAALAGLAAILLLFNQKPGKTR